MAGSRRKYKASIAVARYTWGFAALMICLALVMANR